MANKTKQSNLSSKIASIVERLVNTLPGLVAVYLHGSAAKGLFRPGSDIDLALLFEHDKKPDAKTMFLVRPDLEEFVGRTVDIAILSTENAVFAKEVVAQGELVFCNDKNACDQFEMYALSAYAKLNDERKQILDSYQTNT